MKKRIAIAVATHDTVPATFAVDAMSMCLHIGTQLPPDWQVSVRCVLGTYIHMARQALLIECIREEADYVLWVDGDMRFPKEALAGLIARNQPMVGINYSTRRLPARFVALERADWGDGSGDVKRLETNPSSTGLVKVDALGFGLVLMDLNAIKPALADPNEEPWFWYQWRDTGERMGEDVYFCRLLQRAGIPIYVDQDLSKLCAHSGQIDYITNHALLFKDGVPVEPQIMVPA